MDSQGHTCTREPRALIAVCDPSLRTLIEDVLADVGITRSLLCSPKGLGHIADLCAYDLIVLHPRNPWPEGIPANKRIVLLNSTLGPVAAQDLGIGAVVSMPFELDDLEHALRECMERANAPEAPRAHHRSAR